MEKINITFKSGVTKSVEVGDGDFLKATDAFRKSIAEPKNTHALNDPNFAIDFKEVVMIEKLGEVPGE